MHAAFAMEGSDGPPSIRELAEQTMKNKLYNQKERREKKIHHEVLLNLQQKMETGVGRGEEEEEEGVGPVETLPRNVKVEKPSKHAVALQSEKASSPDYVLVGVLIVVGLIGIAMVMWCGRKGGKKNTQP